MVLNVAAVRKEGVGFSGGLVLPSERQDSRAMP